MPLTPFQQTLARILPIHRTQDSHLAGGAALHLAPQSMRYSQDLDYFHDSAWRFMPAEWREDVGYTLHPIDLAINKLLALAGRDEARDGR